MRIVIEFVDPASMRYESLGDWFYDSDGNLIIQTASTPGNDFGFLVGFHELVEAWLCRKRGITQEIVDRFDISYNGYQGEPGDISTCPYRREHRFAMLLEHLLAHELGISSYGTVT